MSGADLGILWPVVFAGLLLTLPGLLAYAGRFRPLWLGMWPGPTLAFGILWLGLAALILGLGNPLLDQPWAFVIIALPGAICGVIGIVSILWMPQVLQPRWYRGMPADVRKAWRP